MTNDPTEFLLWTSRQTAKVLAISERKLWELTNKGAIPCVRIGRAVRYDPADIRTWIDAQKNRAQTADTPAELP
jgi:excisionase family DNA binding protein